MPSVGNGQEVAGRGTRERLERGGRAVEYRVLQLPETAIEGSKR